MDARNFGNQKGLRIIIEGSVHPTDLMTKALLAVTTHEHVEAPGGILTAGLSRLAESAGMNMILDAR